MSAHTSATKARKFKVDRDVADWHGRYVPYDLVKEFLVALVVVAVLVAVLAVLFGSPDDKPVTIKSWSTNSPVDFAQTAATELDGTSGTAGYGPPYNLNGTAQSIGPFSPEKWLGVHHPIDTAQDYVLGPLATLPDNPQVQAALHEYTSASSTQQATWTAAYEKAVANATFTNGKLVVPAGDYGPVATLIASETAMARSGALDGALLSSRQFYGTDYTKPLLFIADGQYLANLADNQHLSGDQWGMMNETGSYPGQAWLWLYTLWYQVPPMNSSSNGDLQVFSIMIILTVLLALVPFIPGLRSIPRWTRRLPADLAAALPTRSNTRAATRRAAHHSGARENPRCRFRSRTAGRTPQSPGRHLRPGSAAHRRTGRHLLSPPGACSRHGHAHLVGVAHLGDSIPQPSRPGGSPVPTPTRGVKKAAVALVLGGLAVMASACSSNSSSSTTTTAASTTTTAPPIPTTVIPTQPANTAIAATVPSAVRSAGTPDGGHGRHLPAERIHRPGRQHHRRHGRRPDQRHHPDAGPQGQAGQRHLRHHHPRHRLRKVRHGRLVVHRYQGPPEPGRTSSTTSAPASRST